MRAIGTGQAEHGLRTCLLALGRRLRLPERSCEGLWFVFERWDGKGMPAGAAGERIPVAARILPARRAMGEPRAHRPSRTASEAARELREQADAGKLAGEAVDAVLQAVGERGRPPAAPPAGLTAREVEVLRLLARGRTNKQAAAELGISAKTVGRHIESIYSKIGASTRAAAALFAVEHDLLRA